MDLGHLGHPERVIIPEEVPPVRHLVGGPVGRDSDLHTGPVPPRY